MPDWRVVQSGRPELLPPEQDSARYKLIRPAPKVNKPTPWLQKVLSTTVEQYVLIFLVCHVYRCTAWRDTTYLCRWPLESSTRRAWNHHHGMCSGATRMSRTTTKLGPEQVLGRVLAPPTNRRRGPEAPRHKRA
jgi:hypothetical protein